jgi:hypothetical protein
MLESYAAMSQQESQDFIDKLKVRMYNVKVQCLLRTTLI